MVGAGGFRQCERFAEAVDSEPGMTKLNPRLAISLMGKPAVRRGDVPTPQPRGHKAWGLLAFLALSGNPHSRHLLAGMLFPEADDPLGALRWNVSELRRLLGAEATLEGDPIRLELPPGTLLDTNLLLGGSWREAVRLPGLGRSLLEGLDYDSAPSFDMWLINERARLGAASEAILHEATLASLAERRLDDALAYATRLVSLNPFDENAQVLLARALMASGDLEGAERRVESTVRLFRKELGVEPSPSFRMAALSVTTASIANPSPSVVAAQLEAGQAAITAGAWQTGIEALRRAAAAAEAIDDAVLLAQAHLSLGAALVHAARGLDEEGATSLHKASALAQKSDQRRLAANAKRELAYVELLRGRYERAIAWLDEAAALAEGFDAEYAWIAAVRGVCESDIANYANARSWLESAVERAGKAQADVPSAFAHTFLGRLHLLRECLDDARLHLTRGIELARAAGWTAFVPLPLSMLAEVSLLSGAVDSAGETFEHAFSLSCQLGDPCWESLGARGLGLVAAERRESVSAMARLQEAPRLCRRFPDSYLWIEAYALEALCRVAVQSGVPGASAMVAELESIAARTGMREILARALLHRAALGERPARAVAESLIAGIDNPALAARLQRIPG
jgi:DNA-binding SARP family transcriptional activator